MGIQKTFATITNKTWLYLKKKQSCNLRGGGGPGGLHCFFFLFLRYRSKTAKRCMVKIKKRRRIEFFLISQQVVSRLTHQKKKGMEKTIKNLFHFCTSSGTATLEPFLFTVKTLKIIFFAQHSKKKSLAWTQQPELHPNLLATCSFGVWRRYTPRFT